jgi:ElaB/YqjD/DUF883 family membrane-anchored ribosome-binding protein
MTDEIKTEAEKELANIKAEMAKLDTDAKADVSKGESYVKSHIAWIIGIAAALLGFGCGLIVHMA